MANNDSIEPFTMLGGILYLDETTLLDGLTATACRQIGQIRRKAVAAHLAGEQKTVISCAKQISRAVEADKRRRERQDSRKGHPTPKRKTVRKSKDPSVESEVEYRHFREQFLKEVNDPKKIREAERLAFLSGTQIILENN